MLKIYPAETDEEKEIWRELFSEFIRYLKDKLPEFEDLSPKNRRPKNPIEPKLIANYNGMDVGCVGLRKKSDNVCEMLMLHVKLRFRGKKIGRKLAKDIIECAKQLGYHYMRLVTYEPLEAAIKLYGSLGFEKIKRYTAVPLEVEQVAVFMELKLV